MFGRSWSDLFQVVDSDLFLRILGVFLRVYLSKPASKLGGGGAGL